MKERENESAMRHDVHYDVLTGRPPPWVARALRLEDTSRATSKSHEVGAHPERRGRGALHAGNQSSVPRPLEVCPSQVGTAAEQQVVDPVCPPSPARGANDFPTRKKRRPKPAEKGKMATDATSEPRGPGAAEAATAAVHGAPSSPASAAPPTTPPKCAAHRLESSLQSAQAPVPPSPPKAPDAVRPKVAAASPTQPAPTSPVPAQLATSLYFDMRWHAMEAAREVEGWSARPPTLPQTPDSKQPQRTLSLPTKQPSTSAPCSPDVISAPIHVDEQWSVQNEWLEEHFKLSGAILQSGDKPTPKEAKGRAQGAKGAHRSKGHGKGKGHKGKQGASKKRDSKEAEADSVMAI